MKAKIKNNEPYSNSADIFGRVFSVSRRDDPNISATFSFQDDRWFLLDLLRPHEPNFSATIGFHALKEWLRPDAKLYVAHLWLTSAPTANLIQQTMVSLRDLGRLLPDFSGRPVDLNVKHAKEFVRSYCDLNRSAVSNQGVRRRLNGFIAFIRQQYPEGELNNFRLIFPKSKTYKPDPQPLEQAQEKKISTQVLSALIDACAADLKAYLEAKRDYIDPAGNRDARREYQRRYYHRRKNRIADKELTKPEFVMRLVQLHSRAIKAQALILAICAGRRAAAICNTRFNVKTERVDWVSESGQAERVVMVRFREMKLRNIDEDVPCPDAFGELAENAIKTAKKLTAELRVNNPQWKDFLFLVPTKKRKDAKVLTTNQLNQYLNGQHGNGAGILQRYDITASRITIHNFRATRATNAWLGGLQVHEIAYDLGHVNADMTVRHYIVGNEEDRRRFQSFMDKGALSGALEDLVGGREMVHTRLGKRHAEIMRKQGRTLSPTRYGYCSLPSSSGPCIRTTPCYIGPGVGLDGCDYHVLSPDALPALEEDKEVLLANVAAYEGNPDYRIWSQHQKIQLGVVEEKIESAKTLKHRADGCSQDEGPCSCHKV